MKQVPGIFWGVDVRETYCTLPAGRQLMELMEGLLARTPKQRATITRLRVARCLQMPHAHV